jgi:hypothetical protein
MTTYGTCTFGATPEKTIQKALAAELGEREYPMELVGDDADALRNAVNEGIDSHLTAVVRSHFRWRGHCLICGVDHSDMLVILRRLFDNGGDAAWSLRSGILSTLGIEEI